MLVPLRQGKQLRMRELGTFLLLLWRKQPNKFCKWLMLAWLNVLDSTSRYASRWRMTPTENRPQVMKMSWPGHDWNSSWLNKVWRLVKIFVLIKKSNIMIYVFLPLSLIIESINYSVVRTQLDNTCKMQNNLQQCCHVCACQTKESSFLYRIGILAIASIAKW